MVPPRSTSRLRWIACLLAALAAPSLHAQDGSAIHDFSVLHISDIHVAPHLARTPRPESVQGQDTIRWLCEQASLPQDIAPPDRSAPAPAFALATGDLTEYGVIDDTWDIFEQAFKALPCRLYVMPGNHDNTWTASYAVMRKRHGGESYSFDHAGCHFICLSSASPQEPLPTLDAKTRTWLQADLKKLTQPTPVFVALHHPPDSEEFANPAEVDTLVDLLRDYNVVLLLFGHGHSAVRHDVGGLPGVMGGSTWGKNAGYGVLSVHGSDLHYAYHLLHDPAAKDGTGAAVWKPLYEGSLPSAARPRLFEIAQPTDGATVTADTLVVQLTACDATPSAEKPAFTFRIDGEELGKSAGGDAPHDTGLSLAALTPGAHLLSVAAHSADADDIRTRVFYVQRPGADVVWRKHLPAAIKAAPVVAGDQLIVAGNDGLVSALDRRDGAPRWTFATGGEILGTPAWSNQTLVFGSGDGKVYALDAGGQQRWAFDAGLPVYGWPLIADGVVYIGDNGGRMYALSLADGSLRWKYERADFSIESQPALWNDLLVFGAWDGYLYALDRADGQLRWKSFGPKSSEGGSARYYAPADCGPLPLADTLFVCDRGYQLGAYSADGQLRSKFPVKAAAIGRAGADRSFYARTTDDHVCKLSAAGEVLWQADVPAGRFPIAPTEYADCVYVCSNRGRLSVLDAGNGKVLSTFQTTPGFYVMAPVVVGPRSADHPPTCYIAGMDGSLTAVRLPSAVP